MNYFMCIANMNRPSLKNMVVYLYEYIKLVATKVLNQSGQCLEFGWF